MIREELKMKLKELGIKFGPNSSDATLEKMLLEAPTPLDEQERVNSYVDNGEKVMHSPVVLESDTMGISTTATFTNDEAGAYREVAQLFKAVTNLKYKKARYKVGEEILVDTEDVAFFKEKGYIE